MSATPKILAPALCSAGGIIAGTLIAVATMDQPVPLQMSGPVVLAGSMLISDMLMGRAQGHRRGPSATAIFLALTTLAALLVTAVGNATMVPTMLPVIGGGIASSLLSTGRKRSKTSQEPDK